jgi:hypothetical protein
MKVALLGVVMFWWACVVGSMLIVKCRQDAAPTGVEGEASHGKE